ncbi:MAG TPA: sulfite oxidase [Streptosporangiaceae bacterium]|nr:sulfite oxidase [Streptosporangiaceae bacterium]
MSASITDVRDALTMISQVPFNAEAPPAALAGEVTPTPLHYVRSNFPFPAHDGSLIIGGAVANPMTLTLDDLRSLPASERTVTLECAGNGRLGQSPLPAGEPWGRFAVSTARWRGVPLHLVLRQAAPSSDGLEVAFQGADHGRYGQHKDIAFVRSLPLSHACDPAADILIAYDMNSAPLTTEHGAPFRLVVPGWYGMASVKWLRWIDVLATRYEGEFQTSHYMYKYADASSEPVTLMRVRARITDPAPSSAIQAGAYRVRGKAWSGTGPVMSVDVSLTGEGDWYPAELEPAQRPYQWQDWAFEWQSATLGRHTLRARATDAAGHTQPEVPPWNRLGYGNNAVELQYVDVY